MNIIEQVTVLTTPTNAPILGLLTSPPNPLPGEAWSYRIEEPNFLIFTRKPQHITVTMSVDIAENSATIMQVRGPEERIALSAANAFENELVNLLKIYLEDRLTVEAIRKLRGAG